MAAGFAQTMPLGEVAFAEPRCHAHPWYAADMSLVALEYETKTGARIRPK